MTNYIMISEGQARHIASEWHSGMSSALYSLASSGAIDLVRVRDEISRELWRLDVGEVRRELLALDKYARTAGASYASGVVPLLGRVTGERRSNLRTR